MNGLTHEQARRLAHTATGQWLNPKERAALETHLAECPACRAEIAELNWLHANLGRALRMRWAVTRRSPLELAARVRNRLRLNTGRKIVTGLAQAAVRLGGLALVMVMAVGFTGRWRNAEPAPGANPTIAVSELNNPLRFELEIAGEGTTNLVSSVAETDPWPIPTSRPNESRDSRY